MTDEAGPLFANEAFYAAFAAGNFDAMAALWAIESPVLCTHPGWRVLVGREIVLETWRLILSNGEGATVEFRDAEAHMYKAVAVVTCTEVIQGNALAASNIFVRENDQWLLVHHHAGPTADGLTQMDAPPDRGSVH